MKIWEFSSPIVLEAVNKMQNNRIHCSHCARQVVNYDTSSRYAVGKFGFKPRCSFKQNEVICHECDQSDREWEEQEISKYLAY